MSESRALVTVLLRQWSGGDQTALEQLTPLVYEELHRLAVAYMRRERPGHTFCATELVSEAFVRLVGENIPDWHDRTHFFALAARRMRQVLVDHARRRDALKRGRGTVALPLADQASRGQHPDDLLALDEALNLLATLDQRKAQILEMHYFGGLRHKDIAAALAVHENTVIRDLRFAEAWLNHRLTTR
jgi:RNA polymerase sigma factor (TIGR02999 family)